MTDILRENDEIIKENDKDLISIANLTKFYKKFKALDDISLNLNKGKIVGLLGKNGAGKSTMMRCMLGLLRYDGEIRINGEAVSHADHEIFNNMAFIPDVNEIDDRLTVAQTIAYVKGVHPKWNQERADKLIQISQLPMKKKVKTLSKGMKTKLYLIITLSLDVQILLLDEPTIGLDIAFKKEFFNTILGEYFDENKLILISTHQIEEVEHLLQEIIFIHEGKLLLHKEMDTLKDEYNMVTIPIERAADITVHNPLYSTKSLGSLSGLLRSDIKIEGATYTRPQISEVFLALTGGYNATI